MKLIVATSQFPISSNILQNTNYILRQMQFARANKADVIHFPECALSGYAGMDFDSYSSFDWDQLRISSNNIVSAAKQLSLWVVLGSSHPLSNKHKPHNCLYIINPDGKIIDRYDKMFCAGDRLGNTGDLAHYSPGNHFCVFRIKGTMCGALICHEYRYPELYRQYKKLNVQLMFHSYYAGHFSPPKFRSLKANIGKKLQTINPGATLPEITMLSSMIAASSANYMWISCSNTSARHSCWPSFMVRPDGVITGRLKRDISGVLITTINFGKKYYDSTTAWRTRAINGIFHSGKIIKDSRSSNRHEF